MQFKNTTCLYSQVKKKKTRSMHFWVHCPVLLPTFSVNNQGGSGDVTATDTSPNKLQPSSIRSAAKYLSSRVAALWAQLKSVTQPLGISLCRNEKATCCCELVKDSWQKVHYSDRSLKKKNMRGMPWVMWKQFPSQRSAGPPQGLPWDNLSTVQESQINKNLPQQILIAQQLHVDREFLC